MLSVITLGQRVQHKDVTLGLGAGGDFKEEVIFELDLEW